MREKFKAWEDEQAQKKLTKDSKSKTLTPAADAKTKNFAPYHFEDG